MGTVSISIEWMRVFGRNYGFPSPMGTVSISITVDAYAEHKAEWFPSPMGTVSISMMEGLLYCLIDGVSVPYGDRVYLNNTGGETWKSESRFPSPMGTVSISMKVGSR